MRNILLATICAVALLGGCAGAPAAPAAGGEEAVLGAQARQGPPAADDLPISAPDPEGVVAPAVPPPDDNLPVPGQDAAVAPPADVAAPGGGSAQAPTMAQLCEQVRELVEQRGRERALLATLDCQGGNPRAGLRAFVNQVQAQRGKSVPADEADRLLALARALEGQG
jgi:hypothetical protein